MVGRDDHERWTGQLRQPIKERTQSEVGPRDLGRIRIGRILRLPVRWGLVRGVRIEDVHPGEPLAVLAADPVECRRNRFIGATLGHDELRGLADFADAIVVCAESRVEPVPLVEGIGAHERAGREIECLQTGGKRGLTGTHPEPAVVTDAVFVRIAARENRRMRRQREHRVSMREPEPRAVRREAIEMGRRGAPTVRSERITPQRIDGDDEHVAVRADGDGERRGAEPPPRQKAGRGDRQQCRGVRQRRPVRVAPPRAVIRQTSCAPRPGRRRHDRAGRTWSKATPRARTLPDSARRAACPR